MVLENASIWTLFVAAMVGLFALDLGLARVWSSQALQLRVAAWRAVVWACLALLFAVAMWRFASPEAAADFLGAYLKLLPIESVFVFAGVFDLLKIPQVLQVRVVMWGVVGALVARGAITLLGAEVARAFAWALPSFGAVLVMVGLYKLNLARNGHHFDLRRPKALIRRALRVRETEHREHFFVRDGRTWFATPLFLALVLIEATDVIVALDVIPAVLAMTKDPFLLFAANAFALLNFRSLYFLMASAVERLVYVPVAVALGVIVAGSKLAVAPWWSVPTGWYLAVYALLLIGGILWSLVTTRRGQLHSSAQSQGGSS
jgi:tellurite resistance protein TerC